MAGTFLNIASTPAVIRRQQQDGSAGLWAKAGADERGDALTPRETAFIATRDSFYLSTVSETDWPYVQHRGGPKGFLRVLDNHTLAFADYRGNRQFISTGNLDGNDRSCLFLMDYTRRMRLKLFARIEIVEASQWQSLVSTLVGASERGKVSRVFLVHVVAYDWNCPRHITPRYSLEEIEQLGLNGSKAKKK
ncbi:pyridoxamine 5'-phosphate oxidase family protein [Reinekea blandensis]|uniref:Pyridoxamine 5'-phosphate oxidase N-terminal domain-containing protein n=1 Tax=Reinekea blandensis MED297 TaxID=314283 RepID=A4BB34_9GAMM|nr:pyridoxamine 5'-phosphate oxidase family protein [Reinekea blandensis]EAR10647.1 hypothetical protein MED297_11545 [Reinekea sp. MED297] [Reinekea blandensis MED297]